MQKYHDLISTLSLLSYGNEIYSLERSLNLDIFNHHSSSSSSSSSRRNRVRSYPVVLYTKT